MAKLMAPNIRIDWYPEGHFQDIHNPTIAELNSGVNLSCAIVTGYTLDFTDSNTEDTTTIFDTHTSEAILNHSYEADLEFFLAPRGSNADNEAAYRRAEELFYNPDNRVGYLAKRFGFPWNQEYSWQNFNQHIDLFKVQADLPKVVSEEGAPILLNVKYIPQGEAVSGANAGFQYLWTGERYSSPRAVYVEGELKAWNPIAGTNRLIEKIWVQDSPPPPGTHYEWLGERNNSASVRLDGDGNETARNLFRNSRFSGGTSQWQQWSGTNLNVNADGNLVVTYPGASGTNLGIMQQVDIDPSETGEYTLTVRVRRSNEGIVTRFQINQSNFNHATALPLQPSVGEWGTITYTFVDTDLSETGPNSVYIFGNVAGAVGTLEIAWVMLEKRDTFDGYFDGSTESDRAHDLWYNNDGVPHEWVNGTNGEPGGWVESEDTSLVPVPEGFLTTPIHSP